MRRKRDRELQRKLMLFPFMDTFFILLMFFIVISAIQIGGQGVGKLPSEHQPMAPKTRPILTPDAGWGQAHILVQILNGDSVLWLDSRGMPRRRPIDRLDGDIAAFCQAAARCQGSLINIAIRCPGRLSYAAVETVMDKISKGVERGNSVGGNRRLVANLSIVPGEVGALSLAKATHKADTLDVSFD